MHPNLVSILFVVQPEEGCLNEPHVSGLEDADH